MVLLLREPKTRTIECASISVSNISCYLFTLFCPQSRAGKISALSLRLSTTLQRFCILFLGQYIAMHLPAKRFGSSWPQCTFQLNLDKPPPHLQICDYTQKSYEDVRAREKKLAAAKSKRRKETRGTARKIGCPYCVKRQENITLVSAQRHEEQAPKCLEIEALDTLDAGEHGATNPERATMESQCDLPQADTLSTEHSSNVSQLDHARGDVAVPTETSDTTVRVSHAKVSKVSPEWPASDDCSELQCTTTKKPRCRLVRSQDLMVRSKTPSSELFSAIARPYDRHEAHKPKTKRRGSRMARPEAVDAPTVMRALPSSRSGRKRFRPNRPSEDGYQ